MLSKIAFVRGMLLGSAVALATFVSVNAEAATYKLVTSFNGTDGAEPWYGAPTVDSAGNVYLPTYGGGDPNGNGNGTVVEIKAGKRRPIVLHAFNGTDGKHPWGGVLFSETDGKIFGTTCEGGPSGSVGVLYELDPDGTYKVLHNFGGTGDGLCPVDAPARDDAGNLYGVTNGDTISGSGMIWKFSAEGVYGVIHTLDAASDGANPRARLIWNNERSVLFGTTQGGGKQGVGTVFFYAPGTGQFGRSADFNVSNGEYPYGPLVVDSHDNLYGTTLGGGDYDGGVIYKVDPTKPRTTVIHSFNPNDTNGNEPISNLVLIHKTLYGTTGLTGYFNGCGVVFEAGIRANSFYNALHTFADTPDGCDVEAGLALGPNRTLYGDTRGGGENGDGTVFRIRP